MIPARIWPHCPRPAQSSLMGSAFAELRPVPGMSRALEVRGELDPCLRAYIDHRPGRVLGIPDSDRSLTGAHFDAVAVREAVGGLPPVQVRHVTQCARMITNKTHPSGAPTRSVTNSLQLAHTGHRGQRPRVP